MLQPGTPAIVPRRCCPSCCMNVWVRSAWISR
jgi:hypothetical protein